MIAIVSFGMCAKSAAGETAKNPREVTLGVTVFDPKDSLEKVESDYASMGVSNWAAAGATSWESYIRWSGIQKAQNMWDFTQYDKEVEILKKNNMKWVPFLIAGSNYTTPPWFIDSKDSLFYRCLEHDQDSGVQSLFNPAMKPVVDEFIKRFAEHYRPTGVIESVLLGITGDYGEAIYPVSDVGHWTGNYHQHGAFWVGDREAKKSFSLWLASKYGTLDALNKAWGASNASFDSTWPFLRENSPSDAAWLDMNEWRRQSLENWAEYWIGTARKYFPETPIYLCTGGDGALEHGSRFGRQAKIASKYGAGVRITNEGSDYANNFTLTRWVASACKFYKTYFGFEPASAVEEKAVARRAYNASASGARQLFEYTGNVWAGAWKGKYPEWAAKFQAVEALTPVAVFIPETYFVLNSDRLRPFYMTLRGLRDVGDYDFVDELMAADGALDGYSVIFIPDGNVIDDKAGAALEAWARKGGLLVGLELEKAKLASGAPLLIGDEAKTLKETKLKELARSYGKGYVASYSREAASLMELRRMPGFIREMFFRSCALDARFPCLPEADGPTDGVFTAITRDGLLMLNTNDAPYERVVKLHAPTLKRIGVINPPESVVARVEPQSFTLVKFK